MSEQTKPKSVIVKFHGDNGEQIASAIADARDFRTGSRGYGYYGKIEIAGKRYQVTMSLVEIGSKDRR